MRAARTTPFRPDTRGRAVRRPIVQRLVALGTSATLCAMLIGATVGPVTAVVAPPAPAMVQAQGLTDTKVELLWSPVAGATSYDVYRNGSHVTSVPGTLFDDGGRTATTTYSYTVTATVGGVPSPQSAAATATTQATADTTKPTWTGVAPALTAGTPTSSSVVLTWSRAVDDRGVVGYRIWRGEGLATPISIASQGVGLKYTAANLKAGTSYTFRVQAVDGNGNMSAALSATLTTASATDVAPSPPTSGSTFVTPFSDSRIDLIWGNVTGAVGYQIFHATTQGGPYTLAGEVDEVDEPFSPWFSDNGLTPATPYYYVIEALSSGGNLSIPGTEKTATTMGSGDVKIVRGPYVQWVTASSARIVWWTNIASPSVVDYGVAGPTGQTASDTVPVQEHVVLLAPLTAGTAYQYTVGDGASAVSGTAKFRTMAAPGTTFSFDAMGDYGSASVGEKQNASRIAGDDAQFLQTLGDNVYSQAADPDFSTTYSEMDGHFFRQMQPALSAKALWTANGDKEYYGEGAWFRVIYAPNNERWYSYDWGDAHILVLDSTQPFDPASAQFAFAQADLVAHQGSRWRIAVIQNPPYSSTSNNSSSGPVRTSLVPLFQAQKVQLVLSGNSHNYERTFPLIDGAPAAGGITYLVSGNGGNGFNPFTIAPPSYSAFRDATHYGHLRIAVNPSAIGIQEVSAANGATLDSAVLTQFTDIAGSIFKSDIEWLALSGITTGCSPTKYCPDAPVTREQMASFLARALKLSGPAPDAFTDDETSIHEPNINLVARDGITSGCSATKFCPDGLVSREQMASFLARALHLSGAAPDAFTDDETSIHEPNINLIARDGIATGCGGGNFCPIANVTRGEMAAFLHRAFGP